MIKRVVGTLGLIALGQLAWLATGFAAGPPDAAPQAANATTKITVAASEFKFVFSKRSIPPTGTVIFTVVNKGKISHDFKIDGKKTPNMLAWEVREAHGQVHEEGPLRLFVHDPGPCRQPA